MSDPAPEAPPPRWLQALFWLASLSFVGAGLSHVVRGIAQDPSDDSSPTRHAVFVLVDALAAVGLIVRPRWFALPFAVLVLQQLGSHGGNAVSALRAGTSPAVVDVAVALGMPVVLGLLVYELKPRSRGPEGPGSH